jgi:hypothetical protein
VLEDNYAINNAARINKVNEKINSMKKSIDINNSYKYFNLEKFRIQVAIRQIQQELN